MGKVKEFLTLIEEDENLQDTIYANVDVKIKKLHLKNLFDEYFKANKIYPFEISDEDLEEMVRNYYGYYDPNIPENDVWKKVMKKYLEKQVLLQNTEEEKEKIFREVQLHYYMNDAKIHSAEYFKFIEIIPIELSEEDYKNMALCFMNNHDCNIADNDQWYNIVSRYINKIIDEEILNMKYEKEKYDI